MLELKLIENLNINLSFDALFKSRELRIIAFKDVYDKGLNQLDFIIQLKDNDKFDPLNLVDGSIRYRFELIKKALLV